MFIRLNNMDILRFILILFISVILHEFGHYIAAKIVGVPVPTFGIGLPPKLFKVGTWKGTEFTVNLLPLGGFVKLDDDAFNLISPIKKIFVQAMGVISNIIIGFLVVFYLYSSSGVPDTQKVQVDSVVADTPASDVLEKNDIILSANWDDITSIDELKNIINSDSPVIVLSILRNGEIVEYSLIPKIDTTSNRKIIGVKLTNPVVKGDFWKVFDASFNTMTGFYTKLITIIKDGKLLENLTGIKTMYSYLPKGSDVDVQDPAKAANDLWMMTWGFFASINISFALINLMPIPGLDGGQIVMTLPEFFGYKFPKKVYAIINNIGMLFLIFLMLFINVKDFLK